MINKFVKYAKKRWIRIKSLIKPKHRANKNNCPNVPAANLVVISIYSMQA